MVDDEALTPAVERHRFAVGDPLPSDEPAAPARFGGEAGFDRRRVPE
jgi:hypothetical protein